MPNDEGINSELYAYQIIDHLVELGVTYFCIAPGSRSSALTLAAASHPKVETLVHFDERGLAFHALGYSKASLKPAAIIVTSGTAVANLLPAVMEASASRIPMILLTADRPPELRDCGSNQIADHIKIFGNHVRWHIDLACHDPRIPSSYLPSALSYAVFMSKQAPTGPVHINCMFRDPLHSLHPVEYRSSQTSRVEYLPSIATCSEETLQAIGKKLTSYSSGMILVGSLSREEDAKAIFELATKLQWPVVSDITSFMRPYCHSSPCIPYFDPLIKNSDSPHVDCVLHFGDRIVSKALSEWLFKEKPEYILIADHPDRYDPKGQITTRLFCDISWVCKHLEPYVETKPSRLLDPWTLASRGIESQLQQFFSSRENISEVGLIHTLASEIPKDWNLFLANSMPVRDADSFFYPENFTGKVFVNRGVSGIDGNVSTAVGIAAALQKPLIALLGDLTFMHDMNAITQVASSPTPVILLIVNNGGGGIFSFLPIASKANEFEKFFATSHDFHFEEIAKFAGIPFFRPSTKNGLLSTWEDLKKNPRSCFIEVMTDRKENVEEHIELHTFLTEALCSQEELTAR
ncbi:MAG: 2-succinyl-5-enolpyruvyl-6-hydroxy-3-cyclohexene-1-carboxylic-acid synthase [Chlamydiae bacterium]|nr:2-succinyl-5-enolpyruvyl-6-hydroxy-3-cyclohexene-1-carboxylic-acid synthase [Chlamydiota bacterium]